MLVWMSCVRQIEDVDIISMDLKFKSSTGEDVPLQTHEEFLRIAAQKDVYCKLVITPGTVDDEVFDALRMVARVAPDRPVILQPVPPWARSRRPRACSGCSIFMKLA